MTVTYLSNKGKEDMNSDSYSYNLSKKINSIHWNPKLGCNLSFYPIEEEINMAIC
jgi:hypothetical protein